MEKHLEFIQGIINRNNSNSFMLKGWTLAISAALYALAGSVKNPDIVQIAYIPILLIWGLDAVYLSNERCFVDLYNAVVTGGYKLPSKSIYKRKVKNTEVKYEEGTISKYDMNFKRFKVWRNNKWFTVLWSRTVFWFYMPMLVSTRVVFCFFI